MLLLTSMKSALTELMRRPVFWLAIAIPMTVVHFASEFEPSVPPLDATNHLGAMAGILLLTFLGAVVSVLQDGIATHALASRLSDRPLELWKFALQTLPRVLAPTFIVNLLILAGVPLVLPAILFSAMFMCLGPVLFAEPSEGMWAALQRAQSLARPYLISLFVYTGVLTLVALALEIVPDRAFGDFQYAYLLRMSVVAIVQVGLGVFQSVVSASFYLKLSGGNHE